MIYPFTMVETRFGEGSVDAYLLNPIAQAVLLVQRAFWVGTTKNPEETAMTHLPDDLFTRGLISLAGCLVLLAVAQWVFTRFENRIPEHLS
jgi:ABC-2 type transport system permease protein